MNKQDLIIKIQNSDISDERKKQIVDIINSNELDSVIIDQVKDVIQQDIDENVSDILSDDQKKQIMDIENEEIHGIKSIAEEVARDLEFVESEMENIDKTLNSLNSSVDEINIDIVKSDLNKNS